MKAPFFVCIPLICSLALLSCQKEIDDCEVCPECPKVTDTLVVRDTITQNNIKLRDGLVAWYKFDGNLADSSGNDQHAANLSGAGAVGFGTDKSGTGGRAVLLDGLDDVLIADDKGSLVTPSSVTISAYYRTNSTAIQNLVCKRNQFNATAPAEFGGLAWSVNASSSQEAHFAVVSPVGATCDEPRGIDANLDLVWGLQQVVPNQWYHIVCVFHEGSQRIYINGKLREATTRPFTTMRQCPGGKLVIGGFVDDLPTVFNGAIDDLRIYNRLLNTFEITELAKGY